MTNESQSNIERNDDEISLRELVLNMGAWWKYLLSNWLIILGFGFFGGMLGFSYASIKKPIYIAITTFVLEESNSSRSGLGGFSGLASMAGIELGGGGGGLFQGDNIMELYKSRTMIEKTLLTQIDNNDKKELLIDRYIEFNKLKDNWAKNSELNDIRFNNFSEDIDHKIKRSERLKDSIIGTIVNDIKKNYLNVYKQDKKLSIISAEVKAQDEVFAKAFNERLVKNVNDFYIQTKTKKSLNNIAILQQKTDSVRAIMNGAIYSAAAIVDATPNLNPTRQVQRVAPAQRSQFSAETNKAILSSLVQNLELSKMSFLQEAPLIQIVDQPVYPLEIEKIGKVKGAIVGGIFIGFLTVIILILKKFIQGLQ